VKHSDFRFGYRSLGATVRRTLVLTASALLIAVSLGGVVPAGARIGGAVIDRERTPNPGDRNDLDAVDASGPDDVWAVGSTCGPCSGTSSFDTLILHSDGDGTWSRVASPSPGSPFLTGVAAVSPNVAWAVGVRFGSGDARFPLALRWGGSSWVQTPLPDVGAMATLNDVDAIPGLAWAVGDADGETLILRRDSGGWERVPSPTPGEGGYLTGVAVIAADDAWAVGARLRPGAGSSDLALHWNGVTWKSRPVPSPGFSDGLMGVSAVATDDVWATGAYGNSSSEQAMIAVHWDGLVWKKIKTPKPAGTSFNQLVAVSARTANDAWALRDGDRVGLIHWNGTSWSSTPHPALPDTYLGGVVSVGPGNAYAVGYMASSASTDQSLALHWNGTRWTRE
jgi:hypothetical protein